MAEIKKENVDKVLSGLASSAKAVAGLTGKAGKGISQYATITAKFAGVGGLDLDKEDDRLKLRGLIETHNSNPKYQDETHPQIIKLHVMERELELWEKKGWGKVGIVISVGRNC